MSNSELTVSHHARARMQQRGVSVEALCVALERGERIHQDGATIYFLGHRHLPHGLHPALASRYTGTGAVVIDGVVVTVLHQRRLPRYLRRRGVR